MSARSGWYWNACGLQPQRAQAAEQNVLRSRDVDRIDIRALRYGGLMHFHPNNAHGNASNVAIIGNGDLAPHLLQTTAQIAFQSAQSSRNARSLVTQRSVRRTIDALYMGRSHTVSA
jgi:hypothetical protein